MTTLELNVLLLNLEKYRDKKFAEIGKCFDLDMWRELSQKVSILNEAMRIVKKDVDENEG